MVVALAPITSNLRMDRVHCPPWGLAGGLAGKGNEAALRIDGKDINNLPNGKVSQVRLKPGDRFVYRAGGGGGFRERRPREMFEANCSNCGKTAMVPFRPTSGKPVYCDSCFSTRRPAR